MEVKIYREPENESLILDENQLREYNQIAEELGLKPMDGKQSVPNVYLVLNNAMAKQLTALCPCKVGAEKYTRTTIPLEVLKVYKFAKDNEMFDGFQVWYDDKAPDPLLIGWKWNSEKDKEQNYTWNRTPYLIARWGDCAMEINELLDKGFALIKQNVMDSAIIAIEQIKSIVNNPDSHVRKFLGGTSFNLNIITGADGSTL